jgi:hypothetical protein
VAKVQQEILSKRHLFNPSSKELPHPARSVASPYLSPSLLLLRRPTKSHLPLQPLK